MAKLPVFRPDDPGVVSAWTCECGTCGAPVLPARTWHAKSRFVELDLEPAGETGEYWLSRGHWELDGGMPRVVWCDHPAEPPLGFYADCEQAGGPLYRRAHSCLETAARRKEKA